MLLSVFGRSFSGKLLSSRSVASLPQKTTVHGYTAMSSISKTRPAGPIAALQCSYGQRRIYSSKRDKVKLQFPRLPKEWEGIYKPGQMYVNQESLPKLPVPPLQQTLDKYLKCLEPLISEEEMEHTRKVVAAFGRPGGEGEMLHEQLLERARTRDSWLLDWWNHVAYLGFRSSVMVNSNPAIGFPRQPMGDRATFVRKAAYFLLANAKWSLLIQNEAMPPDYYRKRPMCMHHYQLYSKCRIPGPEADTVRTTPISDSRHVLVLRNGHLFRLDLFYETPDGTLAIAPGNHIEKELHRILETASEENKYPVGVLTNEHRDTWYKCRERLVKDPTNRASLDDIETAQFAISLDRPHPHMSDLEPNDDFNDYHRTIEANNSLHGNGTKFNSCNRWSDVCIQMFVNEDGGVGSVLEHSGGDGPPAIAIDIFILQLLKLGYDVLSEPSPVPVDKLRPAKFLEWNISADTAQDIETAKFNTDKLVNDVDLRMVTFSAFGKDLPKTVNLSPDGFMQNAIQLAYYKLYNKTSAMYESGATRWFKYGRTDTIRSTSNASLKFLKAMSNPSATAQEKAAALVESVEAHSDYTIDAISGQAVDRHLLGLSLQAKESGIELPDIFKDPAFGKSMHFNLSTSQVPVADFSIFLCFGAVVPDGYGVCYNPREKQTLLAVSSYRSCPETDSALFLEKLKESLLEMKDVMLTAKGLSAKL